MELQGKKAKRDAERLLTARRRNVLFRAVGMSIVLTIAWKIGMKGGGIEKGIRYLPVDGLSLQEKRLYPMLIGKIEAAKPAMVDELKFSAFEAQGRSFWESIEMDTRYISNVCQLECDAKGLKSQLAYLRCVTYLIYMMLADCANNMQSAGNRDVPKGVSHFIKRMGVFADKVMPEDDIPLRQSMSNAYWNTRDELHGHPEIWWDGGEAYWCPSAEDVRKAL